MRLAFEEIRDYGKGSTQVVRRMRAALEDVEATARPERQGAVALQRRLLEERAAAAPAG